MASICQTLEVILQDDQDITCHQDMINLNTGHHLELNLEQNVELQILKLIIHTI